MPPPTTATPQQIQQIQDLLSAREGLFSKAFGDLGKQMTALGLKGVAGVVDLADAIYSESLNQANKYEKDIVARYGDISTQQEIYGKSMAKLGFERQNELRQDFLQMEAGGVKLMDMFSDMNEAAEDASEIISSIPGAAAQFTDDLQKQNLTIIQALKAAAGLSGEQTGAIMKIAKARGEDSKQMLADIATFSKTLSDKFSVDAKSVAQSVADMTASTSTFGKVSVEAATAAAVKFEAMGVKFEEVADSIGGTFGNFSGAADAAAKLSQVFGVNIDAMQMMVDVNSGPEGMTRALDNMRESLIGAGVDASELSAPLRRLIKEMTGVRDDATIESLFDPDRISIETDDILDSARKAAEAQKDPIEAIKFMDKDIAKVRRSLADLEKLTSEQAITRIGTSTRQAAVAMGDLASASTTTTDSLNQLLLMEPTIDAALKKATTYGEYTAKFLTEGARSLDTLTKNTAVQEFGKKIEETTPIDYGAAQTPGRGVAFDAQYQANTGYKPGETAIRRAEADKAITATRNLALEALGESQQQGQISQQTQDALSAQLSSLQAAMSGVGVDIGDLITTMGIGSPGAASPPGSTAPGPGSPVVAAPGSVAPGPGAIPGTQPAAGATQSAVQSPTAVTSGQLQQLVDYLQGQASATVPGATTRGPGAVTAASPVAPTPVIPAAFPGTTSPASTVTQGPGAPPTPAASARTTASPATPVRTSGTIVPATVGSASAAATANAPIFINMTVNLEAAGVASALARFTNVAVT